MKKVLVFGILSTCSFVLFSQAKQKKTKTTAGASIAGLNESIGKGKVVYGTYCATCHQADGGGVPNLNPPLIKTSYVLGDKSRLIKVVLNGFKENVDIDGDTYSNTMPSLNFLKDQEIADVLSFVRNSFGNKAAAVKVQEVAAARSGTKK